MRPRNILRAYRFGVGDHAALERDFPVAHRDHAAVLRTAEPHPPPPPSLTAPAPPTRIGPDAHRCAPARTCASVPDIATPSNSAAPLPMAITPPLLRCARVQRAARSAKASARRPHRARHATRNAPRAPCRNATTADTPYAACIAGDRAPESHRMQCSRQHATCTKVATTRPSIDPTGLL